MTFQPADGVGALREDRERAFHDEWAEEIDVASVPVLAVSDACTCPEVQWILRELGDLRGRRVLELGCGAGEASVYFAHQGADVTATDVSPGMLNVVAAVARLHGVTVSLQEASAEDLSGFAAESFDIVYGANVLHHVATDRALAEVHRVLKPGGKAAFWDPVAYNPVINVYRRMATGVRTDDEHPLRRRDLASVRLRFEAVRTRFFWLTTLLVFLKFYILDRVHPNEERYWKKVIAEESRIRWWYQPLALLDRALLTLLPPLGWWCWNLAIVATKESRK